MMSSSADMAEGVMGESQPMSAGGGDEGVAGVCAQGKRRHRRYALAPKPRLPSSSYTASRKYVASVPLPLPQPACSREDDTRATSAQDSKVHQKGSAEAHRTSLHADHQNTLGWFLSRRMRSRMFWT
jgi:hypothetical protein